MRAIDADKLLEDIAKIVATDGMVPTEKIGRIIIAITESPALDAVPVVRCQGCKHSTEGADSGNCLCNRKMLGLVRLDDFCSFGERRENDARKAD